MMQHLRCKLQGEWRPSHFLPFVPLSSLENSQLLFWWRFILRNVTSVAFLLNRLYTRHLVFCSTFVIFWPKISDWLFTIDSLRSQLLLVELPLSSQQVNFWTFPIQKIRRLCLILKPLWKTEGGRLEQINSYELATKLTENCHGRKEEAIWHHKTKGGPWCSYDSIKLWHHGDRRKTELLIP